MPTGKKYSVDEAVDILAKCALLRAAIDKLTKKAMESLTETGPELRVIQGGVGNDGTKSESTAPDAGSIPASSTK